MLLALIVLTVSGVLAVLELCSGPGSWRQQWWLLLLPGVMAGSVVYQSRLSRVTVKSEVGRIRTRIATDLHDDVGPSLSQIALLAELAGTRAKGEPEVAELLEQIGGAARSLAESMSDIVWSVDPGKDALGEMIERMQAFAADIFTPRHIRFRVIAPACVTELRLDSGSRRHLFLIFKESLHNIVRHSHCTQAEIHVGIERERLVLRVIDDGRGFDFRRACRGHGLTNMLKRARDAGGEFQVESNGQGTAVTARVPINCHSVLLERPRRTHSLLLPSGWLGQMRILS
jgi:signal transduction histidine kinase